MTFASRRIPITKTPTQQAVVNDYELVVKRCKQLEGFLADHFGATGKGLHEKVSSIDEKLSPALVKRLRFIATVRNKLIHDDEVEKLDDPAGYKEACDKAEAELRAMLKPVSGKGGKLWIVVVAILVVVAVLWLLFKN